MTRSPILPLLLPLLCVALMGGLLAADRADGAAPAEPAVPAVPAAALPAPTGPHAVSTRTLHLVEPGRRDPWVGGRRHLVVTMTYPTRRTGGTGSRYLTPRESRALFAFQESRGAPLPAGLPPGILARTDVGAGAGGPVLRRSGGRPLVLLSPGFSLPRSSLTALATDLASRGYVVAQTSHAHEDSGTELPSGRLLRCAACEIEDYAHVPRVRSRDLSFLLDRLLVPGSGWARTIDHRRIAAAGHSIGGNAAITLAREDLRVDAAVDLDGTLFDRVRRPLETPVMLLGTDELHRPGGEDESWDRTWQRLAGPRTWLTVADSNHGSFTDNPLLIEQLTGQEDPLRGLRAIAISRAYVAAFLDRHLRGRAAPLLDGPSTRFPEVAHHRP